MLSKRTLLNIRVLVQTKSQLVTSIDYFRSQDGIRNTVYRIRLLYIARTVVDCTATYVVSLHVSLRVIAMVKIPELQFCRQEFWPRQRVCFQNAEARSTAAQPPVPTSALCFPCAPAEENKTPRDHYSVDYFQYSVQKKLYSRNS